MDTIGSTTNKPMAQQSQDMADNAADAAQARSARPSALPTRRSTALSQKVDDVRSQAAPMINKVTSRRPRLRRGAAWKPSATPRSSCASAPCRRRT